MNPRTIELEEFSTLAMSPAEVPGRVGVRVWERYSEKIDVQFPSPKTGGLLELTPQGWAGHIPLDESYHLFIKPKVELESLFRMLEYAYKLDFLAEGDLVGAASLQDFYERLARIVALRVLDRSRKGFYREYAGRANRLPYVRGRVLLASMLRAPWDVALDCRYHENTADVEDNRILAWTLFCIARSGFCREHVATVVRRAFRATQGIASPTPCPARLCRGRDYNRLNQDYQPLHALCRFFLDHAGPSHERGENRMLPFLINMARLYEVFVAEWLRGRLPESVLLRDQAPVRLGTESPVDLRVDLLLKDRRSGAPLCLLDTKYKTPVAPSARDLEQVIAYAKATGCPHAVLVYPQKLRAPFDQVIGGDIRVWTATFGLSGDLDAQGDRFLARLLRRIGRAEEGGHPEGREALYVIDD